MHGIKLRDCNNPYFQLVTCCVVCMGYTFEFVRVSVVLFAVSVILLREYTHSFVVEVQCCQRGCL